MSVENNLSGRNPGQVFNQSIEGGNEEVWEFPPFAYTGILRSTQDLLLELGFKVGCCHGKLIYFNATLPQGWTNKPGSLPEWSEIKDELGVPRLYLCKKKSRSKYVLFLTTLSPY